MGKNPDALLRAVQFFMYSIKKSPTNMPFKVIPTDEVIQKESNEIENMGKSQTIYDTNIHMLYPFLAYLQIKIVCYICAA